MKTPISLSFFIYSLILFIVLCFVLFYTENIKLEDYIAASFYLMFITLLFGLPTELTLKKAPILNKYRVINFIYYLASIAIFSFIINPITNLFPNSVCSFILGGSAYVYSMFSPLIIAAIACFIPIEFILIKANKLKYLEPTVSSNYQKAALYVLFALLIIVAILFYLQIRTSGTQIMD